MTTSQFLNNAYKKMLLTFGHQGWWPTTPPRTFTPVYFPRRPWRGLSEQEQFEICLGAILTQNTSWTNVVKVLTQLKKKGVLRYKELAKVPLKRLEGLVKSSGYFRQKAKRVKNFLKVVSHIYNGRFSSLFEGSIEEDRQRLLGIHGIGPETADSILLYAAGRPIFVIDAYTRRIGSRWGVFKGTERYDALQRIFMESLPCSANLFGEFHALLVRLGKEYCTKVPKCGGCPVRSLCLYPKEVGG